VIILVSDQDNLQVLHRLLRFLLCGSQSKTLGVMMKSFCAVLLLSLSMGMVFGAVYMIGSGTSAQNYIPVNGNNEYNWSKFLVTKTELNAAGLISAASISGIGFQVDNFPANYTFRHQSVFIRQTASSAYTLLNEPLPDSTAWLQAFVGDVTFHGDGWLQLAFSSPLSWENVQNLEILWKNRNGAILDGFPQFRYTTTSPNYRAVYKNADGAFPISAGTKTYYRPNVQIITAMPPEACIAVYPQDTGWAVNNAVLAWKSGGGCPTSYDVWFGTQNPPATLVSNDQTSLSYTPSLSPNTTYYWKIVPSNPYGSPANCPVWSFHTPTTVQLAESFEGSTFPPAGWLNPGNFTVSPNFPYHGTKSIYIAAGTSGNLIATPLVSIRSDSRLSFYTRNISTNGNSRIRIKYSADGSVWTILGPAITLPTSTAWLAYEVSLGALAGHDYRLALEAYNAGSSGFVYIHLDHFVGPGLMGAVPAPQTSIATNGQHAVLSWTSVPEAASYNIYSTANPGSWSATPVATVGSSTLSYPIAFNARQFFRVTAVSR
jgi:hypothetical protein